jgi:hypothetical protein
MCAINRVGTEVYLAPFTSGDGKPAHKVGSSGDACLHSCHARPAMTLRNLLMLLLVVGG